MKARLWTDVGQFMRREFDRGLTTMPQAERVAKLADLDRRLLALEREEEFLICKAGDEGTTIPRRERANPAAVLGVEIVSRTSANASGAVMSCKVSLIPGTATGSAARKRSA